jgi:hypothetical protein
MNPTSGKPQLRNRADFVILPPFSLAPELDSWPRLPGTECPFRFRGDGLPIYCTPVGGCPPSLSNG